MLLFVKQVCYNGYAHKSFFVIYNIEDMPVTNIQPIINVSIKNDYEKNIDNTERGAYIHDIK